jgi:type VI protein secretion system component VasF
MPDETRAAVASDHLLDATGTGLDRSGAAARSAADASAPRPATAHLTRLQRHARLGVWVLVICVVFAFAVGYAFGRFATPVAAG